MRVLITGVNGFVARHLVRRLTAFPDAHLFGISLGPNPQLPGLTYYDCDVQNGDALLHVCRDARPTHVCHLAAISSVPGAASNQDATFSVNVLGTRNVFEAAARVGGRPRVLNVSTSQVYDLTQSGPLTEDSAVKPSSVYAATKAMAELWGNLYNDQISWINVRAFNHTGPGQQPSFAIASWTERVASIAAGQAEPVIQTGNLDLYRDFSDVRDVVDAYISLLQSDVTGETFNVCSGTPVLLADLLSQIMEIAGVKAKIAVDQNRLRSQEPKRILGSYAKLARCTGWHPRIPLRQTLEDMLTYWTEKLTKPRIASAELG